MRHWVILVALALVGVGILGLVLRSIAFSVNPPLAMAAFSPYLMVAALIGLVLLVTARCWPVAAVAAVVVVLGALTQIGLYVSDPDPPAGSQLTMMTANLRLGQADPAALVRSIQEHRVDVLSVQELTPAEVDRLRAAGLDSVLPFSTVAAGSDATGVGIWSRYRLQQQQSPTGLTFHLAVARIAVPGVLPEPTVVSTHLAGPWPGSPVLWSADIARLRVILDQLAGQVPAGILLVGGDFNSTMDTAQFRSLLTGGGFQDAAAQAGAGMTRTYPGDRWYPPLIAIDHVLTHNAVATSVSTLALPGSDHRALLSSITLARG